MTKPFSSCKATDEVIFWSSCFNAGTRLVPQSRLETGLEWHEG